MMKWSLKLTLCLLLSNDSYTSICSNHCMALAFTHFRSPKSTWVTGVQEIVSFPCHTLRLAGRLSQTVKLTTISTRQHWTTCTATPAAMVHRRHDEVHILQLNVEGFTQVKGFILEHLAAQNQADALLLRETHQSEPSILKLRDYCLVSYTPENPIVSLPLQRLALWRSNCQRAHPTKI